MIISKNEFFIDIFQTKTKFYISAIELGSKTPDMVELFLNQGKKLVKEWGDNFDNLVMLLQFKFGKLTIRDMNRILYEDFTWFASTPRQKSPQTKPVVSSRSYKSYYQNRRVSEPKHQRVKSRLNLNGKTDQKSMLSQLQSLMKNNL